MIILLPALVLYSSPVAHRLCVAASAEQGRTLMRSVHYSAKWFNQNMQRIAFKMKLFRGHEDEYKIRHDKIWNELKKLLKQFDISDYSIFLDKETNDLFAYLTIDDARKLDELRNEPIMKKWWSYMKDIMETNEDDSPMLIPLEEVFYLK